MYGQSKKYLITWVDNMKNEYCRYCTSRDQVNYLIHLHKLTNDTCTILYQMYYPSADKTKFEIKNKEFFVDNSIKDKFHTYLEMEKHYKAGSFSFRLKPIEKRASNKWPIAVLYKGEEFLVANTTELEDAILNMDLPLRICTKCGLPMTDGWVVNGDEYYCNEEEFNERMDQMYGHHNWRPNPVDDANYNYQYKEKGDNRWYPEDSYYTEWE